MVICKIWDADYPWDVRVEKVCHSLQAKHQIHLVCRNTKRRPTYEEYNGVYIHRLPFLPFYLDKLNTIIGFPAFFNPLWIFTIWRVVRRYRAQMLLVRDLPLALTALLIGRWFGIPVVLDMAENYPAMVQDLWKLRRFSLVNFFVRNPLIVSIIEMICISYVNHILVVVDESRERLIHLGVPPQNISLVMNTPTLQRFSQAQDRQMSLASVREPREDLNLIYLGLLELPRGLETAITAIQEVRQRLPRIKLMILGSGRDEAYFKVLVHRLDLTAHVQFLGWVEYHEAVAYISSADIGLVPHHSTSSWNATIPNKLFDYMSMGKAVIVSNAKPTERIVMAEKCGLVFNDQEPKALAEAILMLAERSLRDELGKRGKDAVMREYNWAVDEKRLLTAIECAAHSGSSR